MVASNDIISHTYQVCLKKSIERIGWIFDFDIKIQIMPLYSVNEMIYFVRQELLKTYDDIKRMRFNNMINILESIDDKNLISSKFNYSINNYYYVFEQMIDKLFHGIEGNEKKKYNPSGYWKLLGHKPKLASNLDQILFTKKMIKLISWMLKSISTALLIILKTCPTLLQCKNKSHMETLL